MVSVRRIEGECRNAGDPRIRTDIANENHQSIRQILPTSKKLATHLNRDDPSANVFFHRTRKNGFLTCVLDFPACTMLHATTGENGSGLGYSRRTEGRTGECRSVSQVDKQRNLPNNSAPKRWGHPQVWKGLRYDKSRTTHRHCAKNRNDGSTTRSPTAEFRVWKYAF